MSLPFLSGGYMVVINRHIDDPMVFFFWEMDEVVVIASTIFIGIMVNMLFSLGIVGIICSYILKKIKKGSSEGVMIHFLYWHGFMHLKKCPRSYIRELSE